MFCKFTMILLALAVLFGSTHAASWSHDHVDSDDHALVFAQASEHADDHDGAHGQMVGQEEQSDSADAKGDVVGHHSHPFEIAVAAVADGFGGTMSGTITAIAPARMLASFSQAPPTQPPSA